MRGARDRQVPGRRIGLRLALAFVAVALAAIAVLAGLAATFASADASRLASRQGSQLTSAIAVAAGAARGRSGSWSDADLAPVLDLASRVGADARILDRSGRVVASTPGFGAHPGPRFQEPVLAHGRRVGAAVTRFTGGGLVGGSPAALRAALWRAIAGSAAIAALISLVAALAVARLITRPVGKLIAVARAMGSGDHATRVGQIHAPAELRELASTFDQMADELDREDQLRRRMVADVAHELRTPIAVLQAGHEALLDKVTEPTPAHLASLRDEVLQLARLVGDLQTLAAARTASLRLDLVRCDLAQVAADTMESLTGRSAAQGVAFERRLVPVEVFADPGRIHQVITNLLTNALKYTPSGGRVTVEAGPVGGQAQLRVTDTGKGIPAEEIPHLFDRFWRGRDTAHIAGSGIGLAVAAELAKAHGGHLAASSRLGQGTTMTLTLPRA